MLALWTGILWYIVTRISRVHRWIGDYPPASGTPERSSERARRLDSPTATPRAIFVIAYLYVSLPQIPPNGFSFGVSVIAVVVVPVVEEWLCRDINWSAVNRITSPKGTLAFSDPRTVSRTQGLIDADATDATMPVGNLPPWPRGIDPSLDGITTLQRGQLRPDDGQ